MRTRPRKPITVDGVYAINDSHSASRSSVLVSGNLGGATTSLVVFPGGVETPFIDADDNPVTIVTNTQDVINNGAGNTIYFKVVGATAATNLVLECYPLTA